MLYLKVSIFRMRVCADYLDSCLQGLRIDNASYVQVSQNALKYRESWQPVLQHLSREGLMGSSSSKSSRELVRQRLRAFNAAFDACIETQSRWIIPEQNLRDSTIAAITQMVVPAYRSFIHQFGSILESRLRDTDKYIKYSPETLETILGELFTGSG